jgi:hypothetical protein
MFVIPHRLISFTFLAHRARCFCHCFSRQDNEDSSNDDADAASTDGITVAPTAFHDNGDVLDQIVFTTEHINTLVMQQAIRVTHCTLDF